MPVLVSTLGGAGGRAGNFGTSGTGGAGGTGGNYNGGNGGNGSGIIQTLYQAAEVEERVIMAKGVPERLLLRESGGVGSPNNAPYIGGNGGAPRTALGTW